MSDDSVPAHLRTIPHATVVAFLDRIDALDGLPLSVRREQAAWRVTGTAWDAQRLANALHWARSNDALAGTIARELSEVAERVAGKRLSNNQVPAQRSVA